MNQNIGVNIFYLCYFGWSKNPNSPNVILFSSQEEANIHNKSARYNWYIITLEEAMLESLK